MGFKCRLKPMPIIAGISAHHNDRLQLLHFLFKDSQPSFHTVRTVGGKLQAECE